ncbi:hypothetical protein PAL_GLEAN10002173 [Pteropus alecto]|uniref:Uncharacterized protein n=1 Tax=Pteropus alecto TaxID=9402 RepID=L5KAM7_PTEAL|nr:hypothetical protein PAL_GLEAN10002173 [Pteropus alecto]
MKGKLRSGTGSHHGARSLLWGRGRGSGRWHRGQAVDTVTVVRGRTASGLGGSRERRQDHGRLRSLGTGDKPAGNTMGRLPASGCSSNLQGSAVSWDGERLKPFLYILTGKSPSDLQELGKQVMKRSRLSQWDRSRLQGPALPLRPLKLRALLKRVLLTDGGAAIVDEAASGAVRAERRRWARPTRKWWRPTAPSSRAVTTEPHAQTLPSVSRWECTTGL